MSDDAAALASYEQIDRLAPRGFCTSKTAVWALRQESLGRFPPGTYREYLSMDWASSPKEEARIARSLVDRHPDYAPAYIKLANLTPGSEQRLALLDAGLAADPDVETPGMLRLNPAAVLQTSTGPTRPGTSWRRSWPCRTSRRPPSRGRDSCWSSDDGGDAQPASAAGRSSFAGLRRPASRTEGLRGSSSGAAPNERRTCSAAGVP